MKKLVVLAAVLLILPAVLAQVTCTDTDNGGEKPEPFIGQKGKVKYGLSEKADVCVNDKDGFSVQSGRWVREYYCANEQRVSDDYDCTRYGYLKCEDGACTGKEAAKARQEAQQAAEPARCGDEIVQPERGEECERPDDICYKNDQIGICTRPGKTGLGGCLCKVYGAGEEAPETPAAGEAPPAQPVTETTPPVEPAPPLPEAPAEEPAQPEELPEKPAGVGFTRTVTNAVKKFFKWMFGIFT